MKEKKERASQSLDCRSNLTNQPKGKFVVSTLSSRVREREKKKLLHNQVLFHVAQKDKDTAWAVNYVWLEENYCRVSCMLP